MKSYEDVKGTKASIVVKGDLGGHGEDKRRVFHQGSCHTLREGEVKCRKTRHNGNRLNCVPSVHQIRGDSRRPESVSDRCNDVRFHTEFLSKTAVGVLRELHASVD